MNLDNLQVKKEFKRYDSIDILRGFSMLSIIFIHVFYYLTKESDYNFISFFFQDGICLIVGASTFLTISGVANGFSYIKNKELKKEDLKRKIFGRGLFVLFVGIVLSLMGGGSKELFNIDILYLFSIITFLFPILWTQQISSLLILSFVIILVTPYMRRQSNFLDSWGGNFESIELTDNIFNISFFYIPSREYQWNYSFKSIFEGYLFHGLFPIFPFIFYVITGVIIAKQFENGSFEDFVPKYIIVSVIIIPLGFILSIIGGSLNESPLTSFIGPLVYYPLSIPHLLINSGFNLLLIIFFHKYFDNDTYDNFLINALRTSGRYSLSLYFYHFCIIYLTIFTVTKFKNTESEAHNIFSSFISFFVAIIIWSFLVFILIPIFQYFGGYGSLEQIMAFIQNNKYCQREISVTETSLNV